MKHTIQSYEDRIKRIRASIQRGDAPHGALYALSECCYRHNMLCVLRHLLEGARTVRKQEDIIRSERMISLYLSVLVMEAENIRYPSDETGYEKAIAALKAAALGACDGSVLDNAEADYGDTMNRRAAKSIRALLAARECIIRLEDMEKKGDI